MNKQWRRVAPVGVTLLAAVGLMLVLASAASAKGVFTIGGKALETSETITGASEVAKFLIPGLVLIINCSSADASGTLLTNGRATVSVLLLGCSVEGNKFCKIYPTKLDDEMKTNAGDKTLNGEGEVILMGGQHYVAAFGNPFATTFIGGAGCTLPLENEVRGETVFKLPNALTPSVSQTLEPVDQMTLELLFSEKYYLQVEELEELGKSVYEACKHEFEAARECLEINPVITFGNQPLWIDGGTTTASLSGAKKGTTWGAE